MTVPVFLLARIAEDEALATEANQRKGSMVQGWWAFDPDLGDGYLWRSYQPEFRDREQQTGMPARVLAECEAKRAMLELLDEAVIGWDELTVGYSPEDWLAKQVAIAWAQSFADHPDFDPEWVA